MKTRKRTKKYCSDHEATTHGLAKWYEYKLKLLGPMVLAKKYNDHRIKDYKRGLLCLHQHLIQKSEVLVNPDKRRDMLILKENVETLMEFVNKHL